MKKITSVFLIAAMFLSVTACSNSENNTSSGSSETSQIPSSQNTAEESKENQTDTNSKDTKTLIAFFSRADENYGVGMIEKGNTQIIAEMIAEETNGELFHIERNTPYPVDYDECTDEAKTEQNNNSRPTLKKDIDVSDYDVIYLGYPNWWGDMPMPVYTFLEGHNFNGKTIIPFCTHAGSGLSGTETSIKSTTGATVLDGLAIPGTTAQNKQDEAKKSVQEWLENLNLTK